MRPITNIAFRTISAGSVRDSVVPVRDLVLAGWTGRDRTALQKHLLELEQLGVKRPQSIPVFYRVSASRLTQAGTIETCGSDSSGEVEFFLVQTGGQLWVGAGSDHTDRKVEAYGITVSKQMYEKPVAGELWSYEELAGHWDQLVLRSWALNQGRRELYQEGTVSLMLSPADLIRGYTGGGTALAEGTLMFSGTLPARGGIRPAERFEFEFEDPVLGRSLRHGYDIEVLPVVG
jgi:hypothetical protein